MTRSLLRRAAALLLALTLSAGMAFVAPVAATANPDCNHMMRCGGGTGGAPPTLPAPVLSGLTVGGVPVNLAPGVVNYSVKVGHSVGTIEITATTGNGVTASFAGGGASTTVPLSVGENGIGFTVSNGTYSQSYRVTVIRAGSSDAGLTGITLSAGTLSPSFAPNTTNYTAAVSNVTTGITVTASPALGATVSINGQPGASGHIPLAVGSNVISITTTAQDGTTMRTTTISVTRAASADSTLSGISLSHGTLSPAFAPSTGAYSATVGYLTKEITVGATVADATAVVTVNGHAAASSVVPLAIGPNTVSIVTLAQDGTTRQTTTIVVTREAPNLNLNALSVTGGSLSPAFAAATTAYTLAVPNSVSEVSVAATAADTAWTLTIDGVHTSSSTIALPVGSKTITARVIAEHGESREYTITVTRAPSSDASLSSLDLSSGTLSPAFNPATTRYAATVGYLTTEVTVAATATHTRSSVTINGQASTALVTPLSVGENTITVVTTAEDGTTTRTSTIVVTRKAANLNLDTLSVVGGTLSPKFDADTTAYTVALPYATNSVDVAAAAVTPGWRLELNGEATNTATIATPVGTSVISARVTAQHGESRTYTITVTRAAASTDARLESVSLSAGTLSPAFAAATTGYTAEVGYLTTALIVGATAADATSTVSIDGNVTRSATVPLTVGSNTITVVTTAEDGTATRTTSIVVTRAAPNLDLDTLEVTGGTLSPRFDGATTGYTLALPYTGSSVDVSAGAAEAAWSVEINGTKADAATVPSPVGTSVITVRVTAEHGEYRDYTVTVARAAASTNASLNGLTLSNGTLSPAFAAAATSYAATVGYLTKQVTVGATADATTTMTINGRAATSATVPLSVGANTVTIVTTAQDGATTRTVELVITRDAAVAAAVSVELDFAAGDDAEGSSTSVSASNLLPGSAATLTMHSTPVVLATGIVLADGTIALSARLPGDAAPGAHRLVFDGTAMDGSAATRTAWFSVLADGTIGAVSLTGPVAYVEPAVAAESTPSALQVTGADAAAPVVLGVGAMAVGLLLLVLGRGLRRRLA